MVRSGQGGTGSLGATGWASMGDAVGSGWHWWAGAARMRLGQCSQPERGGVAVNPTGFVVNSSGCCGQLEGVAVNPGQRRAE